MPVATIEEIQERVGTEIGVSDWLAIDQARIDAFADVTEDHQFIHVDPERAAKTPFRGTVAHGFLTLSLIPMLVWQVYTVENISMGVNYGANKVRFPSPVPVDSTVRAGVELVSVEPGAGGFQCVARVTVERDGADKPACVAEILSVLVP